MLERLFAALDALAHRIERAAIGRASWTLAIGLLVAVVAGLGLMRIEFTNDYRVFFEPNDPQRVANEELETEFTRSDTVNFVLQAAKGDMLTPDRLAAVEKLTEAAWSLPGATRVDSLTNYQYSYGQDDDLIVEPLVADAANAGPEDIARIRRNALGERAVVGRYLSEDATTAQVIVTVNLEAGNTAALTEIADAAEKLKEETAAAHPDLRVATTGVVLLSHSFYDVTQSDLARLVPVMVAFLFVAIWFFFKSWRAALAAIVVLGLSVLVTMGIGGWLGFSLSPASGQVPVIILTIATAEAVHLIGKANSYQRQGYNRSDAAYKSVRLNHAPIALTTITDVLGFLCFNFSETPPFRDLGNMAAYGAIIAYFYSVFFLPALLARVSLGVKGDMLEREHNVAKLAGWSVRHRTLVLGGFSMLALVLGALAPRLEARDNFIEWLSPRHEFRQDAEFINQQLPGIYTLNYGIESGEDGGISEPAYLQTLERFTNWLEGQPEVADVYSIVDVMRRLNRNLHGDDPAYERLPTNREEAAQYLLLYEMNLAQGQDLSDQLTPDKTASRVVVAMNNITSEQMVALKERADAWLKENAPPVMQAQGVGTSLMFAYLTEENSASMVTGTISAFLLIGLMTAIALRSPLLGFVALIPSIIPVIMAFGAWLVIQGDYGLYAAFVTSCALGLTVDSVTHFMMNFSRARRETGGDAKQAVLDAFRGVGMELWIASAVLVVGFLILAFSEFEIIAKLGLMTALIFVFAIATTFVMLPALLSLLSQRRRAGGTLEETGGLEGAGRV